MRQHSDSGELATSRQRITRAVSVAGIVVPFSLAGHWLGGGHLPHRTAAVISFVLLLYVTALFRRKHLAISTLVTLNFSAQFVMHVLFEWFGHVGGSAAQGHPHALHMSAQEQWALASASGQTGEAATAMGEHGWPMFLWHAAVAVIVTLLVGYCRDIGQVLHRSVQALWVPLQLLYTQNFSATRRSKIPVVASISTPAKRDPHLRAVTWRGPPSWAVTPLASCAH